MLLIQVKLIEGVFTALQTQEIIERLTDAIVEIEGENMRPHTWCVVEEVASGEWGIGGRPLPPTTRRRSHEARSPPTTNVRTGDPAEVQRRTFAAPPIMLPTRSTASRSERGSSPTRARSGSPAGPHRPVVSGGLGAKPITTRRRGSGARDVPQCARAPPGATRRQRGRALSNTYANRHRTGARRPATRQLFEADPPQTLCTHRPGFGATHQTGARPAHRFRSRTRKRRCASLVSWFPNSKLLGSCPEGWRSDSQVTG
jgi:4-oxalocrotonate tautomerase